MSPSKPKQSPSKKSKTSQGMRQAPKGGAAMRNWAWAALSADQASMWAPQVLRNIMAC